MRAAASLADVRVRVAMVSDAIRQHAVARIHRQL
jgi:hypothetical protein